MKHANEFLAQIETCLIKWIWQFWLWMKWIVCPQFCEVSSSNHSLFLKYYQKRTHLSRIGFFLSSPHWAVNQNEYTWKIRHAAIRMVQHSSEWNQTSLSIKRTRQATAVPSWQWVFRSVERFLLVFITAFKSTPWGRIHETPNIYMSQMALWCELISFQKLNTSTEAFSRFLFLYIQLTAC